MARLCFKAHFIWRFCEATLSKPISSGCSRVCLNSFDLLLVNSGRNSCIRDSRECNLRHGAFISQDRSWRFYGYSDCLFPFSARKSEFIEASSFFVKRLERRENRQIGRKRNGFKCEFEKSDSGLRKLTPRNSIPWLSIPWLIIKGLILSLVTSLLQFLKQYME